MINGYFPKAKKRVKARKCFERGCNNGRDIVFNTYFLVYSQTNGKGGVVNEESLFGFFWCFLARLGIVCNTIFSKKLANAGFKTSLTLSVGFFLVIIASFIILLFKRIEFARAI